MKETWRLLDSGLGSAPRNVALSRALLEARAAEEIPSTLRFLRYAPCALLAWGQSAAHELDLAECAAHTIPVQRRITGGGVWLADERQLGWELYLHRRDVGNTDLRAISKRLLHAAAAGLSALGVDARYRAGDEIEVDGRTLCSTAHTAEGDGVLLQALLFVELDFERWGRLLKTPGSARGESAAGALRVRVADLRSALGRPADLTQVKHNLAEAFESEFDMEFRDGDLGLSEESRYARALREVDNSHWVEVYARPASNVIVAEGVQALRSGELRAAVRYDASTRTIRQVWFSGALGFDPPRARLDLEAALRDVSLERLARRIEWFFASRPVATAAAQPRDFVAAVSRAAGEPLTA
jgi:lipoate-protein ligase A